MSRVLVPCNHCAVAIRHASYTLASLLPLPTTIAKLMILPALLTLLLSACATEGDFGRTRPTAFTKATDEVLLNTNIMTRGLTWPEFTRDENVLREAGHRLGRPLGPNPQGEIRPSKISFDAQMNGYGTGYRARNTESPLLLIDREIDSDHQALTQFGHYGHRVLVNDSQRLDTLMKRDRGLRAKERDQARARLQENFDYIQTVFEDFGRRLQAYHYAIEEVRVHEPEVVVVEVRGSLDHLRDRAGSIKYELEHFFHAAMARSDARPPMDERDLLSRGDRLTDRLNSLRELPYGQPPATHRDRYYGQPPADHPITHFK